MTFCAGKWCTSFSPEKYVLVGGEVCRPYTDSITRRVIVLLPEFFLLHAHEWGRVIVFGVIKYVFNVCTFTYVPKEFEKSLKPQDITEKPFSSK